MIRIPILIAAFVAFTLSATSAFGAKRKLSEIISGGNPAILVQTVRRPPPFFDSPSSVDANYAIKEGGESQQLVVRYKIADPVLAVSDALCAYLVEQYKLSPPRPERILVRSDDPKEIRRSCAIASGFILDVENVAWVSVSEIRHSTNYIISYTLQLRLIDAASGEVVRSGKYVGSSDADAGGNPYAERSQKDAAVFKAELKKIGDEAIAFFRKKTLSEKG